MNTFKVLLGIVYILVCLTVIWILDMTSLIRAVVLAVYLLVLKMYKKRNEYLQKGNSKRVKNQCEILKQYELLNNT